MQSLKHVIVALRRELEEALASKQPTPQSGTLVADRAVVTLQFQVNGMETSKANAVTFSVPQNKSNEASAVNSVSIEFKFSSSLSGSGLLPPAGAESSGEVAISPVSSDENGALDKITEQLSEVFGRPGFDSSARADVFREALEPLTDAQLKLLLKGLQEKGAAVEDEVVKRALSLLHRVCHSGPSGAVKGKNILAVTFQNYPMKVIVAQVKSVWKSQQDWVG
jgi:hypothetical protein